MKKLTEVLQVVILASMNVLNKKLQLSHVPMILHTV